METISPKNECDRLLQESISLDAQNTKAMLALASLNKDMGNLDKCTSLCRKVRVSAFGHWLGRRLPWEIADGIPMGAGPLNSIIDTVM